MERVIKFKLKALLNPGTYEAMLGDGVHSWSISDVDESEVYIADSESDDFPNLRRELTSQRASYDFYQRRTNDGDNTTWYHGRNGAPEIYSHFGNSESEFIALSNCAS